MSLTDNEQPQYDKDPRLLPDFMTFSLSKMSNLNHLSLHKSPRNPDATNLDEIGLCFFTHNALIVKQDCQGQSPSFSLIFALSFLSTSKRVIVNCINVTQQVSVNAKAGIKVKCYPSVSPTPYKQQLIKYLFLYHYTIIIRNRWYKLGFEHTTYDYEFDAVPLSYRPVCDMNEHTHNMYEYIVTQPFISNQRLSYIYDCLL